MKKKYKHPSYYQISSAIDGNEKAIENVLAFYDPYISKCCLRPLYDEYGNIYIVVDMELKGRIREALIKMILGFDINLEDDIELLNCVHMTVTRFMECVPIVVTTHVETVVLLSHKSPDSVINVKVEFGEGDDKISLDAIAERSKKYQPKPKITYKMIQEYVEQKYGFKVHTAYIAEVKRSLGLTMYDAPNATEKLKQPRKHPPKEKAEAITEALKHFEVI